MSDEAPFTFVISLSVLEHLGRHLYRSFATVLGEAISNAWDADARNVWIYLDRNKDGFWIKDDGHGMSARDLQEKFLKIGYSKRATGTRSARGRPFIGRKGIGKLALLSCAERISVVSKVKGGAYVGGVIDNPELDDAITQDLAPSEYTLGSVSMRAFGKYARKHEHGTIIRFERLKDGVRRSFGFLTKTIALYFRFSLLDRSFRIFVNGMQVTHDQLNDLASSTEFLWKIGDPADPFVEALERRFLKTKRLHETKTIKVAGVRGFVASVDKPRDLKIMTTEERVGVDLFVNGRLRERDILKHIPTARIVENYLYGQIHFDGLDDRQDRFTSSRESIVADDPKYSEFLERFRKVLLGIVEQWDEWRRKHRSEGDPENTKITKAERASRGLYNVVSREFDLAKGSKAAREVDTWVGDLASDASFNFESYAECFVSENLVRRFIREKGIALSPEARGQIDKYKKKEAESMGQANLSIQIRKTGGNLSYLSMDGLANLVDKRDKMKEASLSRDATEFKPIRDAVAHTALLTDEAKARLTGVRQNIRGRVNKLLRDKK